MRQVAVPAPKPYIRSVRTIAQAAAPLEVERHDGDRIGVIRGAKANDYNAGVICAKVARYAERVHHPDRLTTPLRRTGDKGDPHGFAPLSWDDALDEVAAALNRRCAA